MKWYFDTIEAVLVQGFTPLLIGKKSESQGQDLGACMFIKFLVILRFTKFGKLFLVFSSPYPLVDILRRRKERGKKRGQEEAKSLLSLWSARFSLVCICPVQQVRYHLVLLCPASNLFPDVG